MAHRSQTIRSTKVLNKEAAALQITAEQLMREAWERQDETAPPPPKQRIMDEGELKEYQLRKRTFYEDQLKSKRHTPSLWLKYARWEERQKEWDRARSIFERALEIDYKNSYVWSKYVDFEIRHKNVNHARNLLDRAIQLLPRVHSLWYKYILMEYQLAQYANVRRLYERWIEWEPEEPAWNAYIKFELNAGEKERVRRIFERYVMVHRTVKVWFKWIKFEEREQNIANARAIFEKALEILESEGEIPVDFYLSFAEFEERHKELERARTIFRFALDRVPKSQASSLFTRFIQFEKQHGDKDSIEHIILAKRRFQYEELLLEDPRNYDIWFDYIRLEENGGSLERVREVYERAISSQYQPPATEKYLWKRYIYLWISYALFEEFDTQDMDRARAVYKTLIQVIPHRTFSFNKIWMLYASFEIRRRQIDAARKIYGHAIGVAPSDKIFTSYIELEIQLGNIDRARLLYQKWLERAPHNCKAWTKFAELEASLQEHDRSRGIYELAIAQPVLDMPELVWKQYIDFEISRGETDRARNLYRRLLEKTKHVKVWISFAKFEVECGRISAARQIFREAFAFLKPAELVQERVLLIEAWRDFEDEHGNSQTQEEVRKNLPARVKKRRKKVTDNGLDAGYDEYYDYVFPDMRSLRSGLKLLEAARKWKETEQ